MVCLETARVCSDEEKHSADVSCITVLGDKVYSGSDDGVIKMWSTENLQLLKEWKAHDYAILDVLAANDTLYTASMDSTIKAWSLPDLSLKLTFTGLEEPVKKMKIKGEYLFTGDYGGKVNVWTMNGEIKVFYGLSEEVWDFHCQENLLYIVRDRGLTIIETHEGSDKYVVIRSIDGRAPIYIHGDIFLLGARSGTSVTVMNNTKQSYANKGELMGHDKTINAITGWEDTFAVTGGYDDNVKLWNLNSLKEEGSCKVPECVNALATSPEGGLFVGCAEGFVIKMIKKN